MVLVLGEMSKTAQKRSELATATISPIMICSSAERKREETLTDRHQIEIEQATAAEQAVDSVCDWTV